MKTSPNRTRLAAAGWSLALCCLLFVPAAWAKKKAAPVDVNLVWPLPPEKPRIRYVTAIYGASDVEPAKKANFLDHLAGIQRKDFKPTFVKPYGIATDSQGRIYVTDSGQGLVFVLDRENKRVSFLGAGAQVRLRMPIGVTVDAKDRVWVADAVGQHVYEFDPDGAVLMALGQQDEMQNPTGVAVDNARHRLYVVDSRQHTVLVYDSESGQFLAKFGKRGTDKGQFNFPTNVALDREGKIYVTDTLNYRVQIFDPNYTFVAAFGEQGNHFGQFLKPKGLAFDTYQNLYVVDSDFDNFQIFDPHQRLLMFLGSLGQLPGTFWLPAGIHVDRNNRIYVADQNNRRIQIFQLLNGETAPPPVARTAPPETETKGGGAGVNPGSKPEEFSNETK